MNNKPATEATSATALFHMMMFFREASKTQQNINKALMEELAKLREENATLRTANTSMQRRIDTLHQGGRLYGNCVDSYTSLFNDLANNIPQVTEYSAEVRRIVQRSDFAFHMIHGVNFIDLTNEEDTEEEDMEDEDEDMEDEDY
nr:cell division protein zapB [Cressdnaviricota sp.]